MFTLALIVAAVFLCLLLSIYRPHSHTPALITSESPVDLAAVRRLLNQRTSFLLPLAAKALLSQGGETCQKLWAAPDLHWECDMTRPTLPSMEAPAPFSSPDCETMLQQACHITHYV